MKKSLSRGQKLALTNTKIVSSQPPSHGEGPEESPTRKTGKWRGNALSQPPGEKNPPKNRNVVDKQIDEDAELGTGRPFEDAE
jgi:hypothetical protein